MHGLWLGVLLDCTATTSLQSLRRGKTEIASAVFIIIGLYTMT